MLERIARAIGKGAFADKDQEDEEWPQWLPEAIAAVKALREPDLAMRNAGWRAIGEQGFEAEDVEVAHVWRAMIDAALPAPPQETGER